MKLTSKNYCKAIETIEDTKKIINHKNNIINNTASEFIKNITMYELKLYNQFADTLQKAIKQFNVNNPEYTKECILNCTYCKQ